MTPATFADFLAGLRRTRARYAALVEQDAQALAQGIEPLPLRLPDFGVPLELRTELDTEAAAMRRRGEFRGLFTDERMTESGRRRARGRALSDEDKAAIYEEFSELVTGGKRLTDARYALSVKWRLSEKVIKALTPALAGHTATRKRCKPEQVEAICAEYQRQHAANPSTPKYQVWLAVAETCGVSVSMVQYYTAAGM